jgi:hypothetical protein
LEEEEGEEEEKNDLHVCVCVCSQTIALIKTKEKMTNKQMSLPSLD